MPSAEEWGKMPEAPGPTIIGYENVSSSKKQTKKIAAALLQAMLFGREMSRRTDITQGSQCGNYRVCNVDGTAIPNARENWEAALELQGRMRENQHLLFLTAQSEQLRDRQASFE
jgi:hypothetical protein